MTILKPLIFAQFPEIIFGFSTKLGADENAPFYFNLSYSVNDDEKRVHTNRKKFFEGLSLKNVAYQKQVHEATIKYVESSGNAGESDALITNKTNLGLAISTADCTPIFIYDKENKIIAGVHSGWRGTEKKILEKVLHRLKEDYNSSPENLVVYIAPSISQKNYEVGKEVADVFEKKYLLPSKAKFLLDVAAINYDILIKFGVKKHNIQRSELCSYDMNKLLHSYRRDGAISGRSLGIIALKG